MIAVLLALAALIPLDEKVYADLIRAHKGKVVLVNFWATWCEPCREEMPFLASLAAKYKDQGLVLATVSADEPEEAGAALEFLRKSGVKGDAWLKDVKDNDAFIRFVHPEWSGALPALIYFDRQGNKHKVLIGDNDPKVIEDAVRKLL